MISSKAFKLVVTMKSSLLVLHLLAIVQSVQPGLICDRAGCSCSDDGDQTRVNCDCTNLKYSVRIVEFGRVSMIMERFCCQLCRFSFTTV